MAICLATAAASAVVAANAFTLAWTHSIERIRWEEQWVVQGAELMLAEVRIRGHGAGMEPPADARLEAGVWRWRPGTRHAALRLTRSGFTADYQWCVAGAPCVPLAEVLPPDGGVTELRACGDGGTRH